MEQQSQRDLIRRAFAAFKYGTRLRSDDVARLLQSRGIELSAHRLRELGRDSDRGRSISAEELYQLISAWADEQRKDAA
jgi:hypothetical protein